MKPAYHIPLSPDQLALIGEICAIQGQVEALMAECCQRLLAVSPQTARQVFSMQSFPVKIDLLASLVDEKVEGAALKGLMKNFQKSVKEFITDRNDFVHAAYEVALDGGGYFSSTAPFDPAKVGGETVARRTRAPDETKPALELATARDKAAALSVQIAYLALCLTHGMDEDKMSPFYNTLRANGDI